MALVNVIRPAACTSFVFTFKFPFQQELKLTRMGCVVGWQPKWKGWILKDVTFLMCVGSLSDDVGFLFPYAWALLGPGPLG